MVKRTKYYKTYKDINYTNMEQYFKNPFFATFLILFYFIALMSVQKSHKNNMYVQK